MIRLKELFEKSGMSKCNVYLYTPTKELQNSFTLNSTNIGEFTIDFTNLDNNDKQSIDTDKYDLRYMNKRIGQQMVYTNRYPVENLLRYLDTCKNLELDHFEVNNEEKRLIIIVKERK